MPIVKGFLSALGFLPMPTIDISEAQWQGILKAIKRAGRQPYDPDPPKDTSAVNALNERQRRWCYGYVRSGGDIYEAWKSSSMKGTAKDTARRLFANVAVRTFILLIFASVQRRLEAEYAKSAQRKKTQALNEAYSRIEEPETAEAAMTVIQPAAVVGVKGRIMQEVESESVEIASLLNHAFQILNVRAGDFIELEAGPNGKPTGGWKVDVEAVKRAGPGVVRRFARDESGDMKIELADPGEARKFLMDYFLARQGIRLDQKGADVRTLMVNIIQNGDGQQWRQLDELTKQLGSQLRQLREQSEGAVTVAKPEAPPAEDTASETA